MKNLNALKQIEKLIKTQGLLDKRNQEALSVLRETLGSFLPQVTGEMRTAGELPHPKELKSIEAPFVAIYSDGACRGNPGPGSWGVVAQDEKGEKIYESTGVELRTTNNKMELQGAIDGLTQYIAWIENHATYDMRSNVYVFSDSKYVIDGITKWSVNWQKRGWRKADGKAPENLGQWQELSTLKDLFSNCKYIWVKGHNGHPQNEYCDMLANKALDEAGY